MSERLLKALMQLFAIIANPNSSQSGRQPIVEAFLKEQLNQELVDEYLKVFNEFFQIHQKKQASSDKQRKAIAVSSVKILTICNVINQELTQKQKVIVLIRLLEFINYDTAITQQEYEFVATVSEAFNIPNEEFIALKQFVLKEFENYTKSDRIITINSKRVFGEEALRYIFTDGLNGEIFVFNVKIADMHIFLFKDEPELYLNGQLLSPNKIHIISHGSSIRNSRIKPIYYNDIVSAFNYDKIKSKIVFEANNIEYKFKNGITGLHNMSFIEKSGKLVGIMGVSGAGKSTLLNVLNGSFAPNSGEILINGINLHQHPDQLEGIIGYVSQDDLLIEDLSVFENLYYNAKLSFDNYNTFQLYRIVLKLLKNLGLYEIKDMKVGSPLNKKISGGQRKRLNIALELIREPAILFLDEPTSGLSSRDSENILDLLKELTLKGKLVFVVIHQPSSEIFKMFDNLLILDSGGFLIYQGDPVDAIIYYKSRIRQANWNDSVCTVCGNVNPEQIFNIIESRVIDEYGNVTHTRKVSPKEWNESFEEFHKLDKPKRRSILVKRLPEITFKIPKKLKQFRIFISRDILSKLSNSQYILINILESPVLALILSFIIKYFNINSKEATEYNLYENDNLPVYIFMSVIVALFVGLTVSAEEIIKDRKILKREAFLNLSRASYLMSKVALLFGLSAFQSLTFVLIGNYVLEIEGMYFSYWFVLFSTWSFANLMGLNISDAFKTSVTIYILIPFLIIPQILLSGVLVSYDKLNPKISSPDKIPLYGEIILARWSYEALAVHQFKNNEYEIPLYESEKQMSEANYYKFWITSLLNKVNDYKKFITNPVENDDFKAAINLVINELTLKEEADLLPFYFPLDSLNKDEITINALDSLENYFKVLKIYYNKVFKVADDNREQYITDKESTVENKAAFLDLKLSTFNEKLAKFVKQADEFTKIVEYDNKLYRKFEPIYYDSESYFLKAHFYAPRKNIFGISGDTFWVNLMVIWFQTIILYITLYYSLLKKSLEFGEYFRRNLKLKKELKKEVGKQQIMKKNKLYKKIFKLFK
jgi:ABC-type multidrug transport system ATPase subunit